MRAPVFVFLCLLCILPKRGAATHLRAADILVEQTCNSLRFSITIKVYLNTRSSTQFGGFSLSDGHVNFGDGSPQEIIFPAGISGPTPRPDLGPDIAIATFTTFHTYSREGIYKITYFERDRSGGILNIPNSQDVAYTTFVTINAKIGHCNSVPVLQVAPVDRGCRGVLFFHSAGASDADGDSLSYELTTPSQDSVRFADGFLSPDNATFYADFEHGNEAGNARPSFRIDAVSGLITWDAPGIQGEYNIAFRIIEWRFDPSSGAFFIISSSVRDMQIVVEDCENKRPLLSAPADICIEAGKPVSARFVGTDPENHPVKIEVFSVIFDGPSENFPATYEPSVAEFRPSDPPAELTVQWNTNCIHVRDQAYQVVVKITDDPPSGPKLVSFATWNIRVIAPPPVWHSVSPDLSGRTALLQWDEYACRNAEKIQLWRRVGSSPFAPEQCTAGLSVHKGYALIAEFDPGITSFTDTNNGRKLSVGAQYCYRLVATFSSPAGGKSYVSEEVCIGPILADAPVITQVSVVSTDQSKGKIRIGWIKPPDISQDQYPEPYHYEVYRSEGSMGSNPTLISPRIEDKTFFIDTLSDSQNKMYSYQVVLYSRTENNDAFLPIDTSATASTVRLELLAGENKMTLSWKADVPWSNVVPDRPWHRIYRGVAGHEQNAFKLIDSVEVSEFGFEFTDEGKFNDEPIRPDIFYCYYVETVGFYGNEKIPLLFNDSQIACSYPVNNLPLCTPRAGVDAFDCESTTAFQTCEPLSFENKIFWSFGEQEGCRKDAVSFNLYFASGPEKEFALLESGLSQDKFEHNVPSPALCYRVSAVDRNGTESVLSDAVCNDTCPFFQLPNVFTPNGDGCNDRFTPYAGEAEGMLCAPSDPSLCPRFVKSVNLKVMNRWGRVVYEYRSGSGAPVSIDWDGRHKNGSQLEAGMYYYIAEVQFDAINPTLRARKLKGWVHLVY